MPELQAIVSLNFWMNEHSVERQTILIVHTENTVASFKLIRDIIVINSRYFYIDNLLHNKGCRKIKFITNFTRDFLSVFSFQSYSTIELRNTFRQNTSPHLRFILKEIDYEITGFIREFRDA
ncbi:hypothetical protein CLI92_08005 [Vandammella animalimorsus]|uniref:Uncharacterized protein n=1 Tax=Vandammella animalimorsus TaxID=2029117 RepID=A0A2A2T649_9BURK|nr:hypothetical protein CLI92_08005 [Vandammella animalimorsus]PAX19299.1 hypothetical protein CLI93_09025 [Vandammella animalimorsus]